MKQLLHFVITYHCYKLMLKQWCIIS